MGRIGCVLLRIPTRLRSTNFCTSSARFAPSFVRQPNGPECTQMEQNAQNVSLGSNRVDRVRSFRKIPRRLRGTNFCTSSARFAPNFGRQPNGPECTQIVQNAPKRQFRVQWGGPGAFLVKISTRLHGKNFCTSSACFAPSFVRQPNSSKCTEIVRNTPKFIV